MPSVQTSPLHTILRKRLKISDAEFSRKAAAIGVRIHRTEVHAYRVRGRAMSAERAAEVLRVLRGMGLVVGLEQLLGKAA